MNETQRKRRGHAFLPPKAILAKMPSTEQARADLSRASMIWTKYFVGGCTWWILGIDLDDDLAFGYACLSDPDLAEFGDISLSELEGALAAGMFPVERDVYWEPTEVAAADLPGRLTWLPEHAA